jgi:ATP-dependent RNA helicase DDX3X
MYRAETEWGERDGRGGILNPSKVREDESLFNRHSTGLDFAKYEDIPVQASALFLPIHSFEECRFPSSLLDNLHRLSYSVPTPVQKYVISAALEGRDIIAIAQTGSGKTAAFMIPIIHKMILNGPPANSSQKAARPVALILAPTRELAIQIHEEARKLVFLTGIRAVVVYGGAVQHYQAHELGLGCDIIVATPGRLLDFMERGLVQLSQVQYVVMDEADRMLDMGFEPQVKRVLQGLQLEVQTTMCSATFASNVLHLANQFIKNPLVMTLGKVGSASTYVSHEVYYSETRRKVLILHELLKTISGLVLIFVQTKRDADCLVRALCYIGYDAGCIHGDRDQAEREKALAAFRSGDKPILVATDVAQRGLDIPNVAAVVNFDPPHGIEDYVHRVGRTGRAGRDGRGISFLGPNDQRYAQSLYSFFQDNHQEIPQWFTQLVKSVQSENLSFDW